MFFVEQTGQIRILRHGDPGPDSVPPDIVNVNTSVTDSDAIIAWTSNEDTTGYVEYGTTTSLGSFSSLDSTLSGYHRSSLPNLAAQTQYYMRVTAIDAAGVQPIPSPDGIQIPLVAAPADNAGSGNDSDYEECLACQ